MEVPLEEFSEWFGSADRGVALTDTQLHSVSTVFLGIDHNHWGHGPPILFETMVFERATAREEQPDRSRLSCRVSDYLESLNIVRRYPTWNDAEFGHSKVVAEVLRAEMQGVQALNALVSRHA